MLNVGIVGCGTIGAELAAAIQKRFSKVAKVAFLCDQNPTTLRALAQKLHFYPTILSIASLVRRSDFIIEAASQEAVKDIVPLALKLKKPVMVLSVGGLLKLPKSLWLQAKGRIYVPSGAVSGIDAVLAGNSGTIDRVIITTCKPLKGLVGAPFFKRRRLNPNKITKPTLIFQGSAKTAISLFPQNVNVAATLSLAGIGPERTQVRLITSPTFTRNTHEVVCEGNFGRIRTVTENVPSKNPKTSFLAAYSAIACLRKIFSTLKVGT